MNRWLLAATPKHLLTHWTGFKASPIAGRLANGAAWSLVGATFSRGSVLLASLFLARILGKQAFGQLGMLQSTVGMFAVLAGFGMGTTATKHVAEFRSRAPARAGRIMALSSFTAWSAGALMALVLVTLAPWLAERTLGTPRLGNLLRAGALLLLFSAVNGAQTGALSGFEAFKTTARINLVTGALSLPMSVVATCWWGITGATWALVVSSGLNCVLNHVALRRESKSAGVPLVLPGVSREWAVLWNFGLPAALGGALSGLAAWVANAILVNQTDGYSELGVYNAVIKIKQLPEYALGILLTPLLPVLSEKFGARDTAAYHKVASASFAFSLLATAPFAMLQLSAPSLTLLPYGPDYTGYNSVVQWQMLDLAITGIFAPLGYIITSTGRMWFNFFYGICWSILYVGLAAILVPRYGATGLAAAVTLGHVVIVGPSFYYIHHAEPALFRGLPMVRLCLSLTALSVLCFILGRLLTPARSLCCGATAVACLLFMQRRLLTTSIRNPTRDNDK